MKKMLFGQLLVVALLLSGNCRAQSLKDLFSKENVEKVVSAITGENTASMEGTWTYTGAAVEFESDNLLQKAGGSVAASAAESKLNEQLAKIGITEGQLVFTFNADSTFTATLAKKKLSGSYSYDSSEKKVSLKFAKVVSMSAKVNCTSSSMDMLFNADKLLNLLTFLSSKSGNSTLQTIGTLANSYDGMLLGFALKKEE